MARMVRISCLPSGSCSLAIKVSRFTGLIRNVYLNSLTFMASTLREEAMIYSDAGSEFRVPESVSAHLDKHLIVLALLVD